MDRRAAGAWVATMILGGCGGGGGGSASSSDELLASAAAPVTPSPAPAPATPPAPAPTPAPPPAPVRPLTPNIAAWGDSLTGPFVVNLRLLYPSRDIYNGGVTAETSGQIAARQLADGSNHNAWINIFWYGHNNRDKPAEIKADLAASIARLAPGNTAFVVMSVVNQATDKEIKGSPGYATILQLNSELAALYPNNYLDIRSFLVAQYKPGNPQDVLDFQNDTVPLSLRFDEIHLNNDGSELVAKKVKEFLDAKGW